MFPATGKATILVAFLLQAGLIWYTFLHLSSQAEPEKIVTAQAGSWAEHRAPKARNH